jgi:hypothetical protein
VARASTTPLAYGPALLLWAAAAFRLPAVRCHPADLALRAYWLALVSLAAALTVLLAPIAVALDRLLGIPNLARLLGNGLALASSLSVQAFLLLLNFDRAVALRKIRTRSWWLAAALVAMTVLFALAPVDVEAPDFMVVYADAPFVMEYRSVFLAFLGIALVDVVRLCWRYARQTRRPVVALGLRLTAVGATFGLGYIAHAVAFLIARRTGTAYPFSRPDTVTEVLVACAAVLIATGSTMPAWGPRVGLDRLLGWCTAYHTYQRLHPLWAALADASPEIVLNPPPSHLADIIDPRDLRLRLYRRVVEIRDGYLALRPYFDRHTTAAARHRGATAGLSDQRLRFIIEAARIDTAIRNKRQGRMPTDPDTDTALGGGTDTASEAAWLAQVATDFTRSSIVHDTTSTEDAHAG